MPDGDKFYWGVKGTGSGRFLSMARRGAAMEVVADQGARVVPGQLNKPEMRRALRDSLRILDLGLPKLESDSSVPLPPEDWVRGEFRRLRNEVRDNAFAAVALRKIEDIYDGLRASGHSFSGADLKKELGAATTKAVLGYAVLDAKRAGLMQETGRSAQAQLAFERTLLAEVDLRMASNLDRVFDGRGDESLRAPRRRSQPREFTLEELHAPFSASLR